jgi:hypothetical protein
VAPLTNGWLATAVPATRIAYDVPPDWKLDPPSPRQMSDPGGTNQGWMVGGASFRSGYCVKPGQAPGGWRAMTGVTSSRESDSARATLATAETWAKAAFTLPKGPPSTVTAGAPVPFEANGLRGSRVTVKVALTPQDECDPPTGRVDAVAVPVSTGVTAVLVFLADRDVPDQLPEERIDEVLKTLRPIADA